MTSGVGYLAIGTSFCTNESLSRADTSHTRYLENSSSVAPRMRLERIEVNISYFLRLFGTASKSSTHHRMRRTRLQSLLRSVLHLVLSVGILRFGFEAYRVSVFEVVYSEVVKQSLATDCPILVSAVIVSCHESFEELDRCIKSFTAQGYMSISEVIVVHDACKSEDSVRRYSKQLSKVRKVAWESEQRRVTASCTAGLVRFVQHARNRGLAASRNTGMRFSNGLFVWPIDADDFLAPHLLVSLFRRLRRDAVDVFDYYQVNVIMPGLADRRKRLHHWQPKKITSNITHVNPFHCCGMIRREVFNHVTYNELLIYGWEDWDFWINMHHTLGIREYIFTGPWYVYTTSSSTESSMSRFCLAHSDICTATLRLANADKYSESEVRAGRVALMSAESTLWESRDSWANIVQASAESSFAKLLTQIAPHDVNSAYTERAKKVENYASIARSYDTFIHDMDTLISLIRSVREMGLVPYHQIISKCSRGSRSRQLSMHSVISILNADANAVVILHVLNRTMRCSPIEVNELFFPRRVYVAELDLRALAALSQSQGVLKLLSSTKVSKGPYYYSHLTDYIRFSLLFVFGGVYLDTDMILLKAPNGVYNVCMESPGYANGAFLSFEARHDFTRKCLDRFEEVYDRSVWGCVGPDLITSVLRNTNFSGGLVVGGPEAFYSIHWSNQNQMLVKGVTEEVFRAPHVYGYHFWNKVWKSNGRICPGSVASRAFEASCTHTRHQKCIQ